MPSYSKLLTDFYSRWPLHILCKWKCLSIVNPLYWSSKLQMMSFSSKLELKMSHYSKLSMTANIFIKLTVPFNRKWFILYVVNYNWQIYIVNNLHIFCTNVTA